MINKKTIPVAVLLLLAAAGAIAGASQVVGYKVPAGSVVLATGADQSNTARPAVPAAPALSAATGQVVFSDSFATPGLKGWHNLPQTAGLWTVLGTGALQQAGSTADGEISDDASVLVTDDSSFGDTIFEAQVFPTSGDPVGVVFRASDVGYYRLLLAPGIKDNSPKAFLQKVTGGRIEDIATNKTWGGYAYTTWQTINVTTQGSRITVSVDGTTLFNITDSTYSAGSVGVWTVASRGAQFDNIRVQRNGAGR